MQNRILTTKNLVAYYVSSLVGAGILVIPAMTAEVAGPAAIVAWAVLALFSYPVAYVFAQISLVAPDSSGTIRFVSLVFGKGFSEFLAVLLLLTLIAGIPVIGLAGARYLCQALGLTDLSRFSFHLVAMFCVLFNIAFNLIGLRLSSKFQTALLFVLILVLISVLAMTLPTANTALLDPFFPNGYEAVGHAAVICFFCYLGWENVATIADYVENPAITFPTAIRWSVLIVGGLYVAITAALAMTVPHSQIDGNYAVISLLMAGKLGLWGGRASDFISFVLLFLSGNIWVLAAGRLCYSLGRDGILPKPLEKCIAGGDTPYAALLFLGACFTAVLTLQMLSTGTETVLIQVANLNFLVVYVFTFIAAAMFFKDTKGRLFSMLAIAGNVILLPFFTEGVEVALVAAMLILLYLRARGLWARSYG